MNGSGLVAVVVNLDTDRSRIYGANIFIIHSIHIDHVSSQPCHKACIVKLLSARDPCVNATFAKRLLPILLRLKLNVQRRRWGRSGSVLTGFTVTASHSRQCRLNRSTIPPKLHSNLFFQSIAYLPEGLLCLRTKLVTVYSLEHPPLQPHTPDSSDFYNESQRCVCASLQACKRSYRRLSFSNRFGTPLSGLVVVQPEPGEGALP